MTEKSMVHIKPKAPTDWLAMIKEVSTEHWLTLRVTIKIRELLLAGKPARLDAAEAMVKARGLGEVLDVAPTAPAGLMVMNPPYGVRLGDDAALRGMYPKLGDLLKRRFAGWRAYIFSADTELPRSIRLKASRRTPLFNGAIECRLYEYRMVEGSLRVKRVGCEAEKGNREG